MSTETMPFNIRNKCDDHVKCEKLKAFQQNKNFLYICFLRCIC
uniref:Alternative protein EFNA5 n=1 Tax=Homo sapiens TaxID=9606 RepID=L8E7B5_HUMAN|nr:alternative protein EFNA5 [Homo sapiens]